MESTEPYTSIHCRTHYSLLRGVLSPEQVVEVAVSQSAQAVGIADINGFYGLIRFAAAARRRGLKALYSTAIYDQENYLCSLLCLNSSGFARANVILSRHIDAQNRNGRGTEVRYDPITDLIEEGWQGLWVVSPHIRVLERLQQRTSVGLYAGLLYGRPFSELRRWALVRGIKLLAYNDAVYLENGDLHFYRIVRAIGRNQLVESVPPNGGLTAVQRFAGQTEMHRFFSAVPEALQAAEDFSRLAEAYRLPESFIFPAFGELSEADAFQRLRALCTEGIRRRYGTGEGQQPLMQKVLKRLEYELGIIRYKGFSTYFLVVHDIVQRVPRTCGRGSSAASIVAFLLGITHVDPLRYNLFFERFLNMGRSDPPDIDVDFPWDEREETLKYVFASYAGSAAMVADHITFAFRSAIREPARVMGYEKEQLDRLTGLWRRGRTADLPGELQQVVPRLFGMPRNLGTHPGGVVITPGPITNYTHVQTSPLGWPVMAWEKDAAEDAGLVKIDLLGNRSLGVLRDSINLVNTRYDTSIDWESFSPLNNRATRNMIAEGDTLGVFYVESPATRQLLKKMGRGDYEHLVIASSIIRPAANRYINEFVLRLRGGAYRRLPDPAGAALDETYGIMVYQEDVSRIAIAVAGFDAARADGMRKVLSKKNRAEKLEVFHEEFISGGRRRGFSEAVLHELWDAVLSFDGYSFCKAHSASYALLSYRLAWMKRFFPLEFYTAVINNGGGFYARQVYLNAVRRLGYPILGPDVNQSSIEYRIEFVRPSHGRRKGLRIGLRQLRGLSEEVMKRIISQPQRQAQPQGLRFKSVVDFIRRIDPDIASFRALVQIGALDSIADGYTRPQLFWIYSHFEDTEGLFESPAVPGCIKDYPAARKLRDEYQSSGLIFSRHPLEVFLPRVAHYVHPDAPPLVDSQTIAEYCGITIRIAGFLVAEKEIRTTTQQTMSFVSFEDQHGVFETVLFPTVYRRMVEQLETGVAFLLEGKIEYEWGSLQMNVARLFPLTRQAKALIR
ncbi:MAG: PHP domain-containing protein [Spirochaetia bacterium]|nr:PHP domain-containing protein [Spirochaetia bacterium]